MKYHADGGGAYFGYFGENLIPIPHGNNYCCSHEEYANPVGAGGLEPPTSRTRT